MALRTEPPDLSQIWKGNQMLVVSRKQGESIEIGDNIKVVLMRMGGGRVRLGIEAPADVPILRSELVQESANNTEREEP